MRNDYAFHNDPFVKGRNLTLDQALKLELILKGKPDNVKARLNLIAFYNKRSSGISHEEYSHYLWLIDNKPSDLCWRKAADMGYFRNFSNKLFGQAREKWLLSISKFPESAQVIGNAGLFIVTRDLELGDSLLNQAANADPGEEIWLSRSCESNFWYVQYGLHLYRKYYASRSLSTGKRFLSVYGRAGGRKTAAYRVRKLLICARSALVIDELAEAEAFCNEYNDAVNVWSGCAPKLATSLLGLIALRRNDMPTAQAFLMQLDTNMRLNEWDLELAEGLVKFGFKNLVSHYVRRCEELGYWTDRDLMKWFELICKPHTANCFLLGTPWA